MVRAKRCSMGEFYPFTKFLTTQSYWEITLRQTGRALTLTAVTHLDSATGPFPRVHLPETCTTEETGRTDTNRAVTTRTVLPIAVAVTRCGRKRAPRHVRAGDLSPSRQTRSPRGGSSPHRTRVCVGRQPVCRRPLVSRRHGGDVATVSNGVSMPPGTVPACCDCCVSVSRQLCGATTLRSRQPCGLTPLRHNNLVGVTARWHDNAEV